MHSILGGFLYDRPWKSARRSRCGDNDFYANNQYDVYFRLNDENIRLFDDLALDSDNGAP